MKGHSLYWLMRLKIATDLFYSKSVIGSLLKTRYKYLTIRKEASKLEEKVQKKNVFFSFSKKNYQGNFFFSTALCSEKLFGEVLRRFWAPF